MKKRFWLQISCCEGSKNFLDPHCLLNMLSHTLTPNLVSKWISSIANNSITRVWNLKACVCVYVRVCVCVYVCVGVCFGDIWQLKHLSSSSSSFTIVSFPGRDIRCENSTRNLTLALLLCLSTFFEANAWSMVLTLF